MKNYLKMTREGFTLVELMIVVAIIGVLASIAVPQYAKFQAKSRQTEVKIQLGAVYTVEQSFAAENSTYTGCLGQIGYNRDGTKFYYTVGIAKASVNAGACKPGDTTTTGNCNTTQWQYDTTLTPPAYTSATGCPLDDTTTGANAFLANIKEPGGALTIPDGSALTASAVSNTAFKAEGQGIILSKATKMDKWTIDQNKQILNTQSGLE